MPRRPIERADHPRWRWLRRKGTLPLLAIAPQIPTVAAIGALFGTWLWAIVPPCALTIAFLSARAGRRNIAPRGPIHLYLGLWPFFAWWCACFTFTLLSPIALGLALATPVAATDTLYVALALATIQGLAAVRRTPRVRKQTLWFPDLPPELDGYRIVQLSDLHCCVFAPERRVRSWVRRANQLGADLAAVTGDLIASGTEYVDTVASALGELSARDGTFACMGNHDYFGGAGDTMIASLSRHGVRLLRNDSVRIGEKLAIAGIDDAFSRRDDLDGALAETGDAFVVLLAHDPDDFIAAAERGVPLTLSGHTHGGQLAIPFFARRYNLARLVTKLTTGVYRRGRSTLFVSCGIGTSGPPIRIGTRGELALLTLGRGPHQ